MLKASHAAGVDAALEQFGLKTAGVGDLLMRGARGAGRALIGSPKKLYQEGLGAFQRGGSLSARNVFWPSIPGQGFNNFLQKGTTVMSALPIISALRGQGDPNEGHLSNTLGAAGSALGLAYGFPAGGILGSMLGGHAGTTLGKGIGHALGSRPTPRPQLPSPPQYQQLPEASPEPISPPLGGY